MNKLNIINTPVPPVSEAITITGEALGIKKQIVESMKIVETIHEDNRESAIETVKAAKKVLADVESNRKSLKEPYLQLGRRIDGLAKEFIEDIEREARRIETLLGRYNEQKRQKAEEEIRKKREEMERIEQEKMRALKEIEDAKASGSLHHQLEAEEKLEEEFFKQEEVTKDLSKIESGGASGGAQRYKTDVEIVDARLLYAKFPHCFDLKPKLAIIKAMANSGEDLPGVKITRTPIYSVRK